jgi:hypothetical protein
MMLLFPCFTGKILFSFAAILNRLKSRIIHDKSKKGYDVGRSILLLDFKA